MALKILRRKKPRFEKRLVLFVDFLGFKNIVDSIEGNHAGLADLIDALRELHSIDRLEELKSGRFSHFSDCIVLSFRADETSGVYFMISAMALAIIELANKGYLVRGAVTVGDLYHTKEYIVGPALIRAHEMESKEAKYPRVIIDPAVFELARTYRQDHNAPSEEEKFVKGHLKRDADGKWWIDYLSWKSVVEVTGADDELYPRYMERIKVKIEEGLKHGDKGVVEKFEWLDRKFKAALQQERS